MIPLAACILLAVESYAPMQNSETSELLLQSAGWPVGVAPRLAESRSARVELGSMPQVLCSSAGLQPLNPGAAEALMEAIPLPMCFTR